MTRSREGARPARPAWEDRARIRRCAVGTLPWAGLAVTAQRGPEEGRRGWLPSPQGRPWAAPATGRLILEDASGTLRVLPGLCG